MPRELNVVYTDCARKHRQSTSTGNSQVCYFFAGLCTCLFFNSYALWHLSTQGTVSSTMTRHFVAVDRMTMSGLRDAWTLSGNYSFLSRSAWSVQSLACCVMPCFVVLLVGIFCVPSLTNGMTVMPVSSRKTVLWRHLYLPWLRAPLHYDRMSSRVPLFTKSAVCVVC